jgi:guanine nucleotide-binding protein G(i) subunit alpha
MKIIYQSGYSKEEFMEYKPVVYRNLIECAQDLVRGAVNCGESFEEYGNRVRILLPY